MQNITAIKEFCDLYNELYKEYRDEIIYKDKVANFTWNIIKLDDVTIIEMA